MATEIVVDIQNLSLNRNFIHFFNLHLGCQSQQFLSKTVVLHGSSEAIVLIEYNSLSANEVSLTIDTGFAYNCSPRLYTFLTSEYMAVGNSIGNVGFLSPQPLQHRFPQLRQARTCFRTKMSTSTGDSRHAPLTLLSTPVSLFAMRARYIAARKQFPAGTMDIVSPAELGGLKSEQYLAVNPLGKMPALIIRDDPEGTFELFESKVICEYLIDRFPEMKPTFVPTSARGRAIGNLVASLLDSYVGPLNYAMYKPLDPDFDRAAVVKQMDQGFDAIEHVLDSSGPYVAGGDMSIGDIALFARYVHDGNCFTHSTCFKSTHLAVVVALIF